MADIIHRIGIKAPVSKVYAALSTVEGVAGWWTKKSTGEAKPGGTIHVRFLTPSVREMGAMGLEVRELDPNKQIHWRFTSGPEEWVGTDVIFNLS